MKKEVKLNKNVDTLDQLISGIAEKEVEIIQNKEIIDMGKDTSVVIPSDTKVAVEPIVEAPKPIVEAPKPIVEAKDEDESDSDEHEESSFIEKALKIWGDKEVMRGIVKNIGYRIWSQKPGSDRKSKTDIVFYSGMEPLTDFVTKMENKIEALRNEGRIKINSQYFISVTVSYYEDGKKHIFTVIAIRLEGNMVRANDKVDIKIKDKSAKFLQFIQV